MSAPSALAIQAANHVDLWLDLKRRFVALRGSTPGRDGKAVPRTTHRDVLLLATRWTIELARARGDEPSDRSERRRWRDCLTEVERLANEHRTAAEYPANARFWDASGRLAIYLESLKMRPSRWQLAVEALSESIRELPATVGDAGAATAAAARRLLEHPVKLAAVVVGAAVLLPRLFSAR